MTGIGRYILEVKVEIYLGLADVLEGLGWVGVVRVPTVGQGCQLMCERPTPPT